jgi:hypothetical protein
VLQNSDHPLIVSSLLTHGSDALSQEELTPGEKLGLRIIALLLSLPLAPLIEKLDDFAHGFPLLSVQLESVDLSLLRSNG